MRKKKRRGSERGNQNAQHINEKSNTSGTLKYVKAQNKQNKRKKGRNATAVNCNHNKQKGNEKQKEMEKSDKTKAAEMYNNTKVGKEKL